MDKVGIEKTQWAQLVLTLEHGVDLLQRIEAQARGYGSPRLQLVLLVLILWRVW